MGYDVAINTMTRTAYKKHERRRMCWFFGVYERRCATLPEPSKTEYKEKKPLGFEILWRIYIVCRTIATSIKIKSRTHRKRKL